jgi:hypothetical protein
MNDILERAGKVARPFDSGVQGKIRYEVKA